MTDTHPLASRIQEAYTRYPFPGDKPELEKLAPPSAALLAWVRSLAHPAATLLLKKSPSILIAGCGTGFEAFEFAKRMPESRILAFDYSPTAIEQARANPKAQRCPNLAFEQADLTAPDLVARLGSAWDLVACSGVLMHVPDYARALANLAALLGADGLLFLAVNGRNHVSARAREGLKLWGGRVDEFVDSPQERDRLRFLDTVFQAKPKLGTMEAGLLALDVYVPHVHNFTLREWVTHAQAAGLHFHGAQAPVQRIHYSEDPLSHRAVLHLSHGDLCLFLEDIFPSAYHRMVLSHQSPFSIPWTDEAQLDEWYPEVRTWDRSGLPPIAPPYGEPVSVTLSLPGIIDKRQMTASRYVLEFLRRCDGRTPVGAIKAAIPFPVNGEQLRAILNHFYHTSIITMRPTPLA